MVMSRLSTEDLDYPVHVPFFLRQPPDEEDDEDEDEENGDGKQRDEDDEDDEEGDEGYSVRLVA
jgi:hypothetical protein